MAEAAAEAGNPALALAVFGASNQSGLQRDFLAGECLRVTGQRMQNLAIRLVE